MFEVKATVGRRCEFELTDAEIRAAQGLRWSDRYLVLLVSHIPNSDKRAIQLLPQSVPFTANATGRYRTIGSGLRWASNSADRSEAANPGGVVIPVTRPGARAPDRLLPGEARASP